MNDPYVLAVLVYIAFAIFWLFQFVQLMLLSESDFPARHDKVLWVAAFVCVFLIAPLAFMYWKKAYVALRAEQRE